jgi:hypothetical protein
MGNRVSETRSSTCSYSVLEWLWYSRYSCRWNRYQSSTSKGFSFSWRRRYGNGFSAVVWFVSNPSSFQTMSITEWEMLLRLPSDNSWTYKNLWTQLSVCPWWPKNPHCPSISRMILCCWPTFGVISVITISKWFIQNSAFDIFRNITRRIPMLVVYPSKMFFMDGIQAAN